MSPAPKKKRKPWTTTKSLQAIRSVFRKMKFRVEERKGKDGETVFFAIEAGDELESVRAVYEPGTLAIYLVFGVHPARSREAEVVRFANRLNNMTHTGCVLVREEAKKSSKELTVLLRGTVEHRKVRDLEEGYVVSVLAELMDLVQAVDVPLILIAKGASADEAIAKTLNARVAPIRA